MPKISDLFKRIYIEFNQDLKPDQLALNSANMEKLKIEPGDTAALSYVFQESENSEVGAAMLQLGCHLPGHYEAGMFQAFSVEP